MGENNLFAIWLAGVGIGVTLVVAGLSHYTSNLPRLASALILLGSLAVVICVVLISRTLLTDSISLQLANVNTLGPWILILGGPLIGAIWLYFGTPPGQEPAPDPVPPFEARPEAGLPNENPLPNVGEREYSNRTLRQLLALYEGRNALDADELITPYKGLWLETQGEVNRILPDGTPGHSIVVLRNGDDMVDCRFGSAWRNHLRRLGTGDTLNVRGKIADNQIGNNQLLLLQCELM